ncbi:MAG: anhydro-N-acetylmuramic acid kinase [Planctomycetes bacterium]|nr:anhydro-N-acetylmuramic acid kinase [Planctomycetota bacterium]
MKVRLGRRGGRSDAPVRAQPRPTLVKPARLVPVPQRQTTRAPTKGRLVVGCMTGTSLDGIDVALVRITGSGLAIRAELVSCASHPLGDVQAPLRRLAEQQPMTAREISETSLAFTALHVDAIRDLGADRIDLVCVHGQTVFHAPPVSWQLFQPAPLALALGVPVVSDLRAADLAAGGQGAPITPLADHILFRHGSEARAVINLGGFCNLTILPGGDDTSRIGGRDVCACNQVLDHLARRLFDQPYDRDGLHALAGSVDRRALDALTAKLSLQARAGRSLGTGDELAAWVDRHRGRHTPEDLARTACAAIARVIVQHAVPARRLVLAGGGTRNRALVAEIRERAGIPAITSDQLGIPVDMRECVAMAILGALCQDRVPITLPQVTGVEQPPIAGSWTIP